MSPGTATVSVTLPSSSHLGIALSSPVAVVVSDNLVAVNSLKILVYSSGSFSAAAGTVSLYSSATPQVSLALIFGFKNSFLVKGM